jgi:hypothetical protein
MVAKMGSMNKQNLAVEFLLEMLGEGQALPAHVITQEAAARKISSRTLARAKTALQVQSLKVVGEWVWALTRANAKKDNVVTAVTDTPGPAPAISTASGNPEIALHVGPPDIERPEGVGETPAPLPASLSPQAHQDEITPVDDACGDFEPDANPGPPTAVEQAVFRLLDPNHPPIKFTGRQWRQLVVDAHRTRDDGWLRRAVVAGWRLEDLIDRRSGGGLLVAIAGGTIVRLDNGGATIRSATGDQWVYRRLGGAA